MDCFFLLFRLYFPVPWWDLPALWKLFPLSRPLPLQIEVHHTLLFYFHGQIEEALQAFWHFLWSSPYFEGPWQHQVPIFIFIVIFCHFWLALLPLQDDVVVSLHFSKNRRITENDAIDTPGFRSLSSELSKYVSLHRVILEATWDFISVFLFPRFYIFLFESPLMLTDTNIFVFCYCFLFQI